MPKTVVPLTLIVVLTGHYPDRLDLALVSEHHDEGNAYARLGDVLSRLGRKDEARTAYESGISQAEKYGHAGMADDLRLALVQLGEQD